MLGHELRNPLSAIANAATLLERTPDGAVAGRMRVIVQRQVQHLVRIVNDLLDVARVTRGKVVLAKSVVDLAVVVVHAIEALKDTGRFAGRSLDVRVETAPVLGDETRLEQIATNLIENACKYTPAGGHVQVRVDGVDDGQAELCVTDDGRRHPAELLPHVFELVRAGRAHARPRPGRPRARPAGGASGWSTCTAAPSSRTAKAPAAARASSCAFPLHAGRIGGGRRRASQPRVRRQLRVALVEDHADTRESLRGVLEDEGHEVTLAGDGPGGAAAPSTRPDVALVDLGMPGFDGLELARRVRAADPQRAIRLIALTGYGGAEDRAAARAAGFDDYMVKPFDLARFRLWASGAVRDAAD